MSKLRSRSSIGVRVLFVVTLAALVAGPGGSQRVSADYLYQNDTLNCGDRLWDGNGLYNLSCHDFGTNQIGVVLSTGTSIIYWDSFGDTSGGYGHHTAQWGYAGPSSAIAMQLDGNFVLYDDGTYGGGAKWATNTDYSGAEFVNMQTDGNLVLYDHYNNPKWSIF
jgi:hypothetical protein